MFEIERGKNKCFFMSDMRVIPNHVTLDGTTIDVCDIFNYLGLPTLSSKVVICQRFATAWSAIGKLRPMFHSTAPDALKIKLFKSAVETIAAYDSILVGWLECRLWIQR